MIHKFCLLHVLSGSWTKDTILLTDFKSPFQNTSGHPHKKWIKQGKYQKKVRFSRLLDYKHCWQVTHWQKKQMILSAVSLKSLLQKSMKPEGWTPPKTKKINIILHVAASLYIFNQAASQLLHQTQPTLPIEEIERTTLLSATNYITKKFVKVSIVTMYHINPCVMHSLFTTFKAEKLHCTLQTQPLFSKRYSFA